MFEEVADVTGASTAVGSVRSRLGVLVQHGYWPLPNLLMMHQAELELTSSQLNVLLNLLMHYHQRGRLPLPTHEHYREAHGRDLRHSSARTEKPKIEGIR